MSFLSGIANFGRKAIGFLSGDSIASSLVKTAVLGYAVNRLSKSAIKDNNSGTQNIDKGVRLQLNPNAESKIPVLYGDAYFGGNLSDAAMTNDNKTMWYCLTLAEVTGDKFSDSSATSYTFHDVYWNQQRIVFRADGITADYAVDSAGTIDRSISGLVKVYFYAGGSSAGLAPDGYATSTPNADTVFPNWTSQTHPMADLVFALVRVDYNREKNVTGIGEMLFQVESDMKKPGDVFYDYMTSSVYGVGVSSAEINTTSVTALNTYSDSSVAYNDEGTGAQTLPNRYQINGLIDTDENVLKNAEQILSAAASWLSYDIHEGLWSVVINKAGTSVASFSDDNILGSISVGGTGLQDLYNSVKVEFAHRDLRDSGDFVKIEIASADRNANEPDNTLNVTYDIINEPVQAELLGFIELKQSRVDLVVQFETDFSYINLKAGEIIDLTNSGYNFSSKLFRILSVAERQDTDGAIRVEITALEYDSDVYSVQDITRFTRSDDNGIITIGSIGVPNVPQITKFERSNRPRIEIETIAPTGVVEGIEFWITFDDEEEDDTLRSYTLIGTKRPVGGGVYTSGTTVVFEYDNLGAENFYVKVRGINTTTTGPFSDPSAFVEFVPEVVPDAITPDTSVLDSTGGLATALGVVSLLNNLDGLFGGESGEGSLFGKIFETFEDVTGFDIVGETQGGELVVPTNIAIQDEGSEVASSVSVINFTGASVEVSADGTVVTVNHTGDSGGDGGDGGDTGKVLVANTFYPSDRETYELGTSETNPNLAPITGSYYIRYGFDDNSPIFGDLSLGSGNAYLYKSDGTLVSTLAAGSCSISGNVLELPFPTRDLKTDYYILVDEGFVTYCTYNSVGISSSLEWNFNTPEYETSAFNVGSTSSAEFGIEISINECKTLLTITGSDVTELTAGSGNITIEGPTTQSVSAGSLSISGNVATATLPSLNTQSSYTISIPFGILLGTDGCASSIPNSAANTSITTPNELSFVGYAVNSGEFEPTAATDNVSIESNIRLLFSENVQFGSGNIEIYKSDGTLHQAFNVSDTFSSNKVSEELIWTDGSSAYLNSTVDFEKSTSYYVLIDSGAITSICGNTLGITDNTVITFTTDAGPQGTLDTTQLNNGIIELEFDRDVQLASGGNIVIRDSQNNVVETIPPTYGNITIS
jgi:hypothetical protein